MFKHFLPQHIWNIIFQFDDTYKKIFDKIKNDIFTQAWKLWEKQFKLNDLKIIHDSFKELKLYSLIYYDGEELVETMFDAPRCYPSEIKKGCDNYCSYVEYNNHKIILLNRYT